jgi:Ribbon-helix-helix protein, copG family
MTMKDETVVVGVALTAMDLQKVDLMAAATDRSRSAMLRTIIRAAELPSLRGQVTVAKGAKP